MTFRAEDESDWPFPANFGSLLNDLMSLQAILFASIPRAHDVLIAIMIEVNCLLLQDGMTPCRTIPHWHYCAPTQLSPGGILGFPGGTGRTVRRELVVALWLPLGLAFPIRGFAGTSRLPGPVELRSGSR